MFEICKDLLTVAEYDWAKYVKLYRKIMLRILDLLEDEGIVSREFVMCMRYTWHFLDKFRIMNKREKAELTRRFVEMGLRKELLDKIRSIIYEELGGR